jgi:tetrahydromethanopterin S-methyltransferase subunit B
MLNLTASELAEEASKASENITSNIHDVQNELAVLEKLITDLENAQQKTSDALNVFKVN